MGIQRLPLDPVDLKKITECINKGETLEDAIKKILNMNLDRELTEKLTQNSNSEYPKLIATSNDISFYDPCSYRGMETGAEFYKEILSCIKEEDAPHVSREELQKIDKQHEDEYMAEFENNCRMWLLQIKEFVLDTLCEPDKANSQVFIDFLDELNRISVCF